MTFDALLLMIDKKDDYCVKYHPYRRSPISLPRDKTMLTSEFLEYFVTI